MKRLATIFVVLLAALAASADTQSVTINNFAHYGGGEACYVNSMSADLFNRYVYNTVKSQDPSHSSMGSAVFILGFFNSGTRGQCLDITRGSFVLDAPYGDTFVVIVLTDGSDNRQATKAYWSIVPVDGSTAHRHHGERAKFVISKG
jgi:hypothetical protein